MKNIVTTFFVIVYMSAIMGQSLVLEWQSPDSVRLAYDILEVFGAQIEVIDMMENLEKNEGFTSFVESTNLDLLISSISTNAIRSLVMVVLYAVVYILLVMSTILLSVVLINLYGNIYETATRKRIKELASLRVLGTSYDDIHDMVRIENKRVAVFSYLSFIGILLVLSNLNLFTDAPIKHYYMPPIIH